MKKTTSLQRLDKYITGKGLTDDELRYMHLDMVKMIAYEMKDYGDYEHIEGRIALLQKSYGRGVFLKEVAYILDQTALTKWQKFWLKFRYVFL